MVRFASSCLRQDESESIQIVDESQHSNLDQVQLPFEERRRVGISKPERRRTRILRVLRLSG